MSSSLEPEGSDETGLTGFERSLGSLQPASHVNRDRILFLAGQQHANSLRRPHWYASNFWPAIAASLAVVSIGQGFLLARRPASETLTVYVQTPQPQAEENATTDPVSRPRIVGRSRDGSDLQSKTLNHRRSLTFRDDLAALPKSPVIALAPSNKPLTAAQGLKIKVHDSANLGDSL